MGLFEALGGVVGLQQAPCQCGCHIQQALLPNQAPFTPGQLDAMLSPPGTYANRVQRALWGRDYKPDDEGVAERSLWKTEYQP